MGEYQIERESRTCRIRVACRYLHASGDVEVGGNRRFSDWVNQRAAIYRLRNVVLEGIEAFGTTLPDLVVYRSGIYYMTLEEDASAPPLVDSYPSRERLRVRLSIGESVVEGDMHVAPTVELHRHLDTYQSDFLALTNAVVDGPTGHFSSELLLVSQQHITVAVDVSGGGESAGASEDAAGAAAGADSRLPEGTTAGSEESGTSGEHEIIGKRQDAPLAGVGARS